jgi:hypothetical protein
MYLTPTANKTFLFPCGHRVNMNIFNLNFKISDTGQSEDVTLYVVAGKKPPRLLHPTVGCKMVCNHLFPVYTVE